jgi:hypothetical protein
MPILALIPIVARRTIVLPDEWSAMTSNRGVECRHANATITVKVAEVLSLAAGSLMAAGRGGHWSAGMVPGTVGGVLLAVAPVVLAIQVVIAG